MAQVDEINICHSMCYRSMFLTSCYKISGDKIFYNKLVTIYDNINLF